MAELFNDCAHEGADKLAWLEERPLVAGRVGGGDVPSVDYDPIDHQGIKLADGSHVGYYNDSTVHLSDTKHDNWYHNVKFGGHVEMGFDNKIMSHALQVTGSTWDKNINQQAIPYNTLHHNCQNFTSAAISEYQKEGGEIYYRRSFF